MNLELDASLATAALFIGMLLFSEIGRRMGTARLARKPDGLPKGVAAMEAAVFSLLGLLIAFTFSGAASRFENRRALISAEANAIGTAYLRIDLLPADAQPPLRELFRRYVDTRSTAYQDAEDQNVTKERLATGMALQGDIWKTALIACRRPEAQPQATMLMVPALNEMIDITTTRATATQSHPPMVVFLLLGGLSLVGALLMGYGTSRNKDRTWLHTVAFAAILSVTVYVIIDLEYPRLGLIRANAFDQILVDLRKSMG